MSYIGNGPPLLAQYGVESFNGGGTSFTLSKPAATATVLVFIDGVRQTPTDAYSVSGVTLTTTATTPSGTDNVTVQFLGDVVDFGEPSDDSVSTAKIQDDAVTAAKLANSINTEITANTAKVTNATHTGDVTGATALTIATDAVDIAMLSATGTADATTFLRGDNAWAAAGGGKVLQVVQTVKDSSFSSSQAAGGTVAITGMSVAITPSTSSNKILICLTTGYGQGGIGLIRLLANGSGIADGDASQTYTGTTDQSGDIMYLHSPGTTATQTYTLTVQNIYSLTYTMRYNYTWSWSTGSMISTMTAMEIEA